MFNTTPCLIDIEASSLEAASYPIEIAWSLQNGDIESHLINPQSIATWTDWDDYAELAIHGIDRPTLFAQGQSPAWVAARMNACLHGKTVYTDGLEYDQQWLNALFDAAGLKPDFTLTGIEQLWSQAPKLRAAGIHAPDILNACQESAEHEAPYQHRAAGDVAHLLAWWRCLCG